jgi:hypothetical protein
VALQKDLARWLTDPDLAGVRDTDGLKRLPAEERASWEELWKPILIQLEIWLTLLVP